MFPGLDERQLGAAIEAMLFVTDEPVSTITLADMLQVKPVEVEMACVDLATHLEQGGSGVMLQELAGGWRLTTRPEFHGLLEQYVLSWDTRKLSQAMLEVLAVVAYTQPVTRQGVASVRGVNSDSSINSLIDKGLIREAGFADTPGNPVLYATTRTFLEKFGLRSLSELPDLEEFAADEETRKFIVTRLSSTRSDAVLTQTEAEELQEESVFDAEEFSDKASEAVQGALTEALLQSSGIVEKIDFDELQFEE